MSVHAKDIFKIAVVAVDGLDVIQGLTGIGGDKADASLAAIARIVRSLRDGYAGKTSPEIIASELAAIVHQAELDANEIKQGHQANSDAADRRVAERLKKGE